MKKIFATLILTFSSSFVLAESTFNEVNSVIHDLGALPTSTQQASDELWVYRSGQLPQYEVNMKSVFQFGSSLLEQAAKKTIEDHADYRERLPKLLHPNGVCVTGLWQMNQDSVYTGAFAPGSKLFIGRISVAMEETKSGSKRGFGFAGKIFPTQDADSLVQTENFFSVDVLTGAKTERFLSTSMTNEPEIGFDFWTLRLGLKIASALKLADSNPSFRPVKNLAQMGVPAGGQLRFPKWIRIGASSRNIGNSEPDFRKEVLRASADNRDLVFNVDGSDTTSDRNADSGWSGLGQIHIKEAVVSYGCDRRLHFGHPKLN
jgi:hypothetical protein